MHNSIVASHQFSQFVNIIFINSSSSSNNKYSNCRQHTMLTHAIVHNALCGNCESQASCHTLGMHCSNWGTKTHSVPHILFVWLLGARVQRSSWSYSTDNKRNKATSLWVDGSGIGKRHPIFHPTVYELYTNIQFNVQIIWNDSTIFRSICMALILHTI